MYEVIPDTAFHWKLVNKVTGRVVVEGVPRNKAVEIKRQLEGNRVRREASLQGGA